LSHDPTAANEPSMLISRADSGCRTTKMNNKKAIIIIIIIT